MSTKNLKKILNFSEMLTDRRVREVADRNGARVCPKMRLADLLQIEQSGISDNLYKFALQSHFDFVVADVNTTSPLFAVEFDGPAHFEDARQKERDRAKNELCDRFEFPLLRINNRYLEAKYRGIDLLTWAMEVWFAARAFADAQADGSVPEDEPFIPWAVVHIPGHETRFPLWLSLQPQLEITQAFEAGRCLDRIPSIISGVDADGNHRALGFLRMTEDRVLIAESGVRSQRFPIDESELLDEVIAFDLAEHLRAVGTTSEERNTKAELQEKLATFREKCDIRTAHWTGREPTEIITP